MEAKSVQKYTITSPQKLREVVYLIKKMRPVDAVERLPFTYKKAAEPLMKVIKSAIANARQKGASDSELVFKEIQINQGPRLKRYRAGSRGRAKPYQKRMSHIRVVVETKALSKEVVKEETTSKSQVQNEIVAEAKTENVKKAPKKGGVKKVTTKKKEAK